MNINELDIKSQVQILSSGLVSDKIHRMILGGAFTNDEFILTIGEEEFMFMANCVADRMSTNGRVNRKYTPTQQETYRNKLIDLGFMYYEKGVYTVYLDEVRKFFDDTNTDPTKTSKTIDEYITETIQYS